MKNLHLLLFLVATTTFQINAAAKDIITDFANDDKGNLKHWVQSSEHSGFVDTEVLYQGKASFRLRKAANSEGPSVFVLQRIPMPEGAQTIELSAQLKAKGTGPWAGVNIMLRQDQNNSAIEFMNSRPFVSGEDTDWHRVRVRQNINPNADSLVFGAVLVGPGEAWINDVELLVNGDRVTQTPDALAEATATGMESLGQLELIWNELDDKTIQAISHFSKAWGMLKYFHPEISQGNSNWDFYFVESVRDIVQGESARKLLRPYLEFLSELQQKQNEGSKHLEVESRYAYEDELGLATFSYERHYNNPSIEYELRLLAIARLWNIVEYWYPYRAEMDVDWERELQVFMRRAANAESESEFRYLLQAMLAKLKDGHAMLSVSAFRSGACRLPFTVRHLEGQVVITRLDTEDTSTEIQVGDVIVAINGQPVQTSLESKVTDYPASNTRSAYYQLANDLLSVGCDSAPTELIIKRGSDQFAWDVSDHTQLPANPEHGLPGERVQRLKSDIVYMKLAGLTFTDVENALDEISATDKVVIDARGYPHDFVLYSIAGAFADKDYEFAKLQRVAPKEPGVVSTLEHIPTVSATESRPTAGIAILVDETTFSQPEFSALAWRELPKAIVVGSTTAGAVGNIRNVPLPNGLTAWFTGLRVLDNCGDDVQHLGIKPDIYVKPTIENVASGKDIVIETAIEALSTLQPQGVGEYENTRQGHGRGC